MKKRALCYLMSLLILSPYLVPTAVFAEQVDNGYVNTFENSRMDTTKELPMPYLPTENRALSRTEHSEYETWKDQTETYLENHYKQGITEIKDEVDSCIFTFFVDPNNTKDEQVESIIYYKKSADEQKTNVGATKITNYSRWSNGARPISVDSEFVSNYASSVSTMIDLVTNLEKPVSFVVNLVASYLDWKVDKVLPIKAETRMIARYKRRVGSYFLSTGVWYPSVQIGRAEYWYYQTVYQPAYKNGPWIPHHYDNIPNSTGSDYNHFKDKKHYYHYAWITAKVKEIKNSTNVYIDIFD